MKKRIFAFACAAAILGLTAAAQSAANTQQSLIGQPWIGVWQATLDGQPSVTLTLADDTGALEGTVVFNVMSRNDGGATRVLASQPHVLLHPHWDSNTLAFQARRPNGTTINISVAFNADGHAQIHCLDCGPDAPIADLVRAPLTPQ